MRNSRNKLTLVAAITLIGSLIAGCGANSEDSATVTATASVSQETVISSSTESVDSSTTVIPASTTVPAKTTANTTTASPKTTTAPLKTTATTTTAPPTSVTTTTAPPKTSTTTTTAPASTSYTVTTQGFSFSPSSLTIAVNSTVTFQVGGGHNLAWDCEGTQNTGTFSRTFTAPGRYEYCCTSHGGMTGVIIVQ